MGHGKFNKPYAYYVTSSKLISSLGTSGNFTLFLCVYSLRLKLLLWKFVDGLKEGYLMGIITLLSQNCAESKTNFCRIRSASRTSRRSFRFSQREEKPISVFRDKCTRRKKLELIGPILSRCNPPPSASKHNHSQFQKISRENLNASESLF